MGELQHHSEKCDSEQAQRDQERQFECQAREAIAKAAHLDALLHEEKDGFLGEIQDMRREYKQRISDISLNEVELKEEIAVLKAASAHSDSDDNESLYAASRASGISSNSRTSLRRLKQDRRNRNKTGFKALDAIIIDPTERLKDLRKAIKKAEKEIDEVEMKTEMAEEPTPYEDGDQVNAVSDFFTDSIKKCAIFAGTLGIIKRIDEDGDMFIQFDGNTEAQWVHKKNIKRNLVRKHRKLSAEGQLTGFSGFAFWAADKAVSVVKGDREEARLSTRSSRQSSKLPDNEAQAAAGQQVDVGPKRGWFSRQSSKLPNNEAEASRQSSKLPTEAEAEAEAAAEAQHPGVELGVIDADAQKGLLQVRMANRKNRHKGT